MAERKLIPVKEREFEFNDDTSLGKRYIHKFGADEDLYNVKRQFDEILQRYGVTLREHVRVSPGKIIFSETAYKVWQEYVMLEPVRKSRTPPELRLFVASDSDTYVLKLLDETARVVAGTLTANAKEIHNVADVNITYDKDKNEIYIDKTSLANYLKAIKQNKPFLLQNNPGFHKYVVSTLNAIESTNTFKKDVNFSNAHAMSSLSFRATDNKAAVRNKVKHRDTLLQSEERDDISPLPSAAAAA